MAHHMEGKSKLLKGSHLHACKLPFASWFSVLELASFRLKQVWLSETAKDVSAYNMSIESYAMELRGALHQYPNFPQEGILFEDFLPIFREPQLFRKLVEAFKMHLQEKFPNKKIDILLVLNPVGFCSALL